MPVVFISYSWDSQEHKAWVKGLAQRLIDKGVQVILDQSDCPLGASFTLTMEEALTKGDRVLVILTENYKRKADNRQYGVGFEGQIISAELYQNGRSNKFIPVLRSGDSIQSTPAYLQGRHGVDMRSDVDFEPEFLRLLEGISEYSDKPSQGSPPDFGTKSEVVNADIPGKPSNFALLKLAELRDAVLANSPLPPLDKAAILAITAHSPRTLEEYRLTRIAEWSQPRYELDRRFTRLTLQVDQDTERQASAQSFDDLRKVLDEVIESALVVLGPPGSGKSTLLRRLELDLAVEALRNPNDEAALSFFLPLNRYLPAQPGLPLPSPQAWLEQQWSASNTGRHLPPLATLLADGPFVLLLDAVNEMSHADAGDYSKAIGHWRIFLADLKSRFPRVRLVFSCRRQDYTAELSAGSRIPHVRIEQLDNAQVEQFLALYKPGQGPVLWRQLQGSPQLDLFRSPFYLNLLLNQVGMEGKVPQGRAELFSGFVRQALAREVNEVQNPLFHPSHQLLVKSDFQRILQRDRMGTHELAKDSPLFPALSAFARQLQENQGAAQMARVRVEQTEAVAMLGGNPFGEVWNGRVLNPPLPVTVHSLPGNAGVPPAIIAAKMAALPGKSGGGLNGYPLPNPTIGEAVLEASLALQVLDKQDGDVLFVHQLFQEYFAARAICSAPAPELAKTAWRANELSPSLQQTLETLADYEPLPPVPSTGWEETFLLAAEMLDSPVAFINALANVNLPLAGRCAALVNPVETNNPLSVKEGRGMSTLCQQLRQLLLVRSRNPKADLRARIAAAHALGELGDPRFHRVEGPQVVYLLPPMVAVKGGVYTLGSDEGLYEDEAPAHTVQINAFSIGQFPVTNAEWRCFQEGGGYDDECWWETAEAKRWQRGENTGEGAKQQGRDIRQLLRHDPGKIQELLNKKEITSKDAEDLKFYRDASDAEFDAQLEKWHPPGRQTQPRFWNDPAFNAPAQPVVGVCWHEARAYCAWLTAQTGLVYRLPTEAEWEAAARGLPRQHWWRGPDKPRIYPWGERFDPACCNSFESHLRGTSPIGVFPAGDSPEGIADLSGNVWEWTGSLMANYPYHSGDGREDAETGAARVVRGGSWDLYARYCRSAYRFNGRPDYRYSGTGFRCARVQS